MILVDTSIWIDHFRYDNAILSALLHDTAVLTHPFVIGELAMGNLRQRDAILEALSNLPQAVAAQDPEVLGFINREHLFGAGIGLIDAHLLAATRLTPHAALWTGDKRLGAAAERLGLSAKITQMRCGYPFEGKFHNKRRNGPAQALAAASILAR